MLLELNTPELDHGSILLDGTYGRWPAEEELLLTGQVENGRFQSPTLSVLLDLVGADRVRDSWIEMTESLYLKRVCLILQRRV